jgi:putative ABC transport system permease protein
MGPLTVTAEALNSLSKNVGRTALSILGIVIGIASVIAMMAVGSGTQQAVDREMSMLGDDWIVVWYEGVRRGVVRGKGGILPNVARDDARAVAEQCSTIRLVSLTQMFGGKQIVSSYGNHNTVVRGVDMPYWDIRHEEVARGRPMTPEDLAMRTKVCWLGVTVVEKLFGTMDPVGQSVRIDRHPLEVAGVLAFKGSGLGGDDLDDNILVPLTTMETLIAGNRPPNVFFAAVRKGSTIDRAKEQITSLLRERHHVKEPGEEPFGMWDRSEMARMRGRMTGTFKTLLTFIGSISLLVGGVGIMNIMLVSVTERTREIGVRMAIGAKGSHVLTQFLCEAVVLCFIGGVLGFALGWALANFTAYSFMEDLLGGLPVKCELSYAMVAVAIGVSAAVGVFFGFYPAWRASRLNPIDALRYE